MEEYLRATAIADHMIQASDSLFGWTITGIYVGPFAFSFRAALTDLRRTSAPQADLKVFNFVVGHPHAIDTRLRRHRDVSGRNCRISQHFTKLQDFAEV